MWINHFKLKLKQLGVKYEEASKTMGMTINGFNAAMRNGTFSFRNMLKLAEKYDFSLDELRFDETDNRVEETSFNYKRNVENIHSLKDKDFVAKQQYEDLKKIYEDRIKDMQGQMQFLQHLIDNK